MILNYELRGMWKEITVEYFEIFPMKKERPKPAVRMAGRNRSRSHYTATCGDIGWNM